MSSRKRSDLWYHFKVREEDKTKARCNYCLNYVSVSGGSTSNLSRHMKTRHPTVPLEIRRVSEVSDNNCTRPRESASTSSSEVSESEPQPSTSTSSSTELSQTELHSDTSETASGSNVKIKKHIPSSSNITDYGSFSKPVSQFKSKMFDRQLVKMIVKEYQPFRIVEDNEFKKFVQMLCPGYTLPSRKTISENLIPQEYVKAVDELKNQLSNANLLALQQTDGHPSITIGLLQ